MALSDGNGVTLFLSSGETTGTYVNQTVMTGEESPVITDLINGPYGTDFPSGLFRNRPLWD